MHCRSAGPDELHRAALLANELSALYASAVRRLLARARVGARAVAAIGCHGQTVRHRPQAGYTLQLVNGARLAELTGITVVCDFRSRDIAAGGEGAPLVPAFHHAMFGAARRSRVIVNVGGIANITVPSRARRRHRLRLRAGQLPARRLDPAEAAQALRRRRSMGRERHVSSRVC